MVNGKCEQVDARKLKKQSVQSLLRVNSLQDALKANFEKVHFLSRFPLSTDPKIKTACQWLFMGLYIWKKNKIGGLQKNESK